MPRTWSCPFWKWEEGRRVYCEGCRLHFKDGAARRQYIDRFCTNVPGWEDCTVAQALMRQEEGDEKEKDGPGDDPGPEAGK